MHEKWYEKFLSYIFMVYFPYKEYMSINDKKICSRTKAYFLIGSDQLPNRLQNKYLKEIFGELNE